MKGARRSYVDARTTLESLQKDVVARQKDIIQYQYDYESREYVQNLQIELIELQSERIPEEQQKMNKAARTIREYEAQVPDWERKLAETSKQRAVAETALNLALQTREKELAPYVAQVKSSKAEKETNTKTLLSSKTTSRRRFHA